MRYNFKSKTGLIQILTLIFLSAQALTATAAVIQLPEGKQQIFLELINRSDSEAVFSPPYPTMAVLAWDIPGKPALRYAKYAIVNLENYKTVEDKKTIVVIDRDSSLFVRINTPNLPNDYVLYMAEGNFEINQKTELLPMLRIVNGELQYDIKSLSCEVRKIAQGRIKITIKILNLTQPVFSKVKRN